jgi:hypothetical protein
VLLVNGLRDAIRTIAERDGDPPIQSVSAGLKEAGEKGDLAGRIQRLIEWKERELVIRAGGTKPPPEE